MTIPELLHNMVSEKTLSVAQLDTLLDIHEKRLFPVHRELRFFLYIGILMIIAGVGLTVRQYFSNLGDVAVIGALSLGCSAAFVYSFLKGNAYVREEATSSTIAFDYILFLGCAFFSMDIAYIEMKFHLLGDLWNNYLLVSAALFLFLAYRFDNRLVLSMALSTIAAWFGFTLSGHRFSFAQYYREYAIAYGCAVFLLGGLLYRLEIKRHFFAVYLNFAVHFLGIALISGIIRYKLFSLYFLGLLAACALLVVYSLRSRKFLYLLYAVIYGYIGISIVLVDQISRQTLLVLLYFITTSLAVIGLIFFFSRKFKEEG